MDDRAARRREYLPIIALLLVVLPCPAYAAAEEQDAAEADDRPCWYGPCLCVPRKTLFQWSYGTSFGGGPDLEEPIVTDRPDFTEASSTVGRRVLQLETGYTHGFDNDGVDQSIGHSFPEALFRIGMLADWFEARFAWNYAAQRVNGATNDGADDLYVGAKIGLTPQEGILPEMALVPQMTVPTGASQFTADQVLPGANWLYGWDISEHLSTAGSTQVNRSIDETGTEYHEWAQSWTIGYGLTDRVGAYTEWFAFFPHDAATAKPEHYFDGGFTVLINNDVQWDIRAGVGLNDAAEDYFLGTGLSIRFQ